MPKTQETHSEIPSIQARHQVEGGVYLVVADDTAEFYIALKYAAKMAHANGCHVGVLRILEPQDFQHWGNIEERMRAEQHEEAEAVFADVKSRLEKYEDITVDFYTEEGGRMETLARVIENNSNITMLILGGGEHGGGPGPLVSHFTGKGMAKLNVPVLIVPEHLNS